jgi:hypothetical protein
MVPRFSLQIVRVLFDEPLDNKVPKIRLRTFATLAQGLPLSEDCSLPHIKHRLLRANKPSGPLCRQKERCWKAVLLRNQDTHESNEWDTVRAHFMKSRSTKVLSIIQKK